MNYYRLSAYSLTLRKDDVFYPGVSIEDIVALYDFDAKLRSIIFEYSSKVETTLRAYIAYYHAQKYGPLGYLNNQNFDNELTIANSCQSFSTIFIARRTYLLFTIGKTKKQFILFGLL